LFLRNKCIFSKVQIKENKSRLHGHKKMNSKSVFRNEERLQFLLNWGSYIPFILFLFLCIRLIIADLGVFNGTLLTAGISGVIIAVCAVWWNPLLMLLIFICFVPFQSGIQQMGYIPQFAPVLSAGFAGIYISWFVKHVLFKGKSVKPVYVFDIWIDALACLIMISLIMVLTKYPLDFILYRLIRINLGQLDPFWALESAFIMLQGLFLYRILSIEYHRKNFFITATRIMCILAVIIAFFSAYEFYAISLKNSNNFLFIRVHFPFEDIHSYGSCVILIFFFCLLQLLGKQKINFFFVFSSAIFLILILLSLSRSAWLVFGFVFMVFLLTFFYGLSLRKKVVFTIALIACVAIVNIYSNSFFNEYSPVSDKMRTLRSPQTILKIDYVRTRFLAWKMALELLYKNPFSGRGIGTYYRNSRYTVDKNIYKTKLLRRVRLYLKKHESDGENTHNYYLQLTSELGTPGIFLFLTILFLVFKKGFEVLKLLDNSENDLDNNNRNTIKGLMFGLFAYLLTLIPGHALLLSNQQFIFWFAIAGITINYRKKIDYDNLNESKTLKIAVIASLVVFFYVWDAQTFEYGKYEYGFYNPIKIKDVKGKTMRWAMPMTGEEVFPETEYLCLTIYAEPEHLKDNTLETKVFINDVLIDKLVWNKKGIKQLYYHIPGIKDKAKGKSLIIRTSSSGSFNLYKLGISKDIHQSRDKSIAISSVVFSKNPKAKYKNIILER